jgi:hypothetical protein
LHAHQGRLLEFAAVRWTIESETTSAAVATALDGRHEHWPSSDARPAERRAEHANVLREIILPSPEDVNRRIAALLAFGAGRAAPNTGDAPLPFRRSDAQ